MIRIYTLLIFATIISGLKAQTIVVPSMHASDTAYATGGILTDASGNNTFGQSGSGQLYLFPQTHGQYIKLTFTSFSLGPNDQLIISNGTGYYSQYIGTFNGNNIPSVIYASNINGSLTINFYCQSNFIYQGFSANIQCVSTLPPPDLTFSNYHTSFYQNLNSLAAGSLFTAITSIKNKGVKPVPGTTNFYLSTDTIIDASDSLLAIVKTDTVAGGQELYKYTQVIIPASVTPGNYYFISVIDATNSIAESDENNNKNISSLTIIDPIIDLVFNFNSYYNPAFLSSRPGADFSIAGTFLNYGNCNLPPVHVAAYLSTDNYLDNADQLMDTFSLNTQHSVSSYGSIGTIRISANTIPGNYRLFLKADPFNEYAETNELNNIQSIPINLSLPISDIQMNNMQTSSTWTVGGYCNIYYSLLTQDIPYYTKWPTKIVLSHDSIIDAGDLILKTDTAIYGYYYGLSGGFNDTLPSGILPGNYYCIAYTDYNNQVHEINESNNTFIKQIHINPHEIDIYNPKPTIYNKDVAKGGKLICRVEPKNQKGSICPRFMMGYYLSNDTILNASDLLLDTKSIIGIYGNSSAYLYDTLLIPAITSSGQYYILFKADNDYVITESNENNNISYEKISVSAPAVDLVSNYFYMSYQYADTLPHGVAVNFTIVINNAGNWLADTTTTTLLLSTDNIVDSGDIILASKPTLSIGPGETKYSYFTLGIPASIPDGDYYLIGYTDHANSITESNENNNFITKKIIIGAGGSSIFNMPSNGNVVHTTCGEVIYDSGGNGTYNNNDHGSLTLYPGINGNYVSLDFFEMSFDACCDYLSIYDGPSLSDSLIGSFSFLPSKIVSTHSSGALTIKTTTNSSTVKSGFKALATCVPYSAPDLSLMKYYYYNSPEFVQGESGTISFLQKNEGTRTAAASITDLYLSNDSIYDASDIFLISHLSSYIIPGAQLYDAANLTFPAGTVPGNYYIILKADNTNTIQEKNETNNIISQPIIIHSPSIDLIPYATYIYQGYYYYYPSIIFYPGAQMTVETNANNIGYKRTDTSIVEFYFSIDTTLDPNDIYAGTSYAGSNLPTTGFSHHKILNVPTTLASGNYYLIVKVDATNMFNETNENNNVQYVPITIHPATMDFKLDNVNINSHITTPGRSLLLTKRIIESGNVPFSTTAPIITGYYLSSDSIVDPSDLLLTSTSDSLGYYFHNYYNNINIPLSIPPSTNPGKYILIVWADKTQTYPESDEQNNIVYFQVDIYPDTPDLSISCLTSTQQSAIINPNVSISYSLENFGYGNAGNVQIAYYISQDSILDGSDSVLSTTSIVAPGNTSQSMNAYLTLPANLSGNYYLIVQADPPNNIIEMHENNNIALFPLNYASRTIDFSLLSCKTAVSDITPGYPVPITCAFKTSGNITSSNQTIGYYLSTDTLWDVTDVLIKTITGIWAYPNYYTPITNSTITIPSGTALGQYSILFYADHNNTVQESNENNNIKHYEINVASSSFDLKPLSIKMNETSAPSGGEFTITPVILNSGSASTSSYKTGFFLSTDTLFDASDIFIDQRITNSLNPGTRDSSQCTVNIPSTVTAGNYYLIAYADYLNYVSEVSETNNYIYKAVSIVDGFHDIDLYYPYGNSWSSGITSPNNIYLYYTNWNTGNLSYNNITTAFYFSLDTIKDASDILLGTQINYSVVYPGQQSNNNFTFSLPAGTPYGNYYVITVADYQNGLVESNEVNNAKYTFLKYMYYPYNSNFPDLHLYDLISSDTLQQNGNDNVSAKVYTSYNGVSSSQVAFYLSDNWLLDHNDLLLATLDSGALLGYNYKKVESSLNIPSSITPGIHYLIAAVDYNNIITEANENDNIQVKAIYVANITGIVEHSENFEFIIYPNPTAGMINFSGHFSKEEWGSKLTVEVLNNSGASIYKENIFNDIDIIKKITLPETGNGIYFLKISGNLKTSCSKYVKVN